MKNNVRVERAKLNISQTELAEKIGITRQAIYSIENNKYIPSTVLALKMARIFKTTVENIFELDNLD